MLAEILKNNASHAEVCFLFGLILAVVAGALYVMEKYPKFAAAFVAFTLAFFAIGWMYLT